MHLIKFVLQIAKRFDFACINFVIATLISNSVYAQNSPQAVVSPQSAIVPVPAATGYATGIPVNYVRSWQPLIPITDATAVLTGGYTQVQQSTQYVDGLGRPLQTVGRSATPLGKDLVAPVVYDAFGREVYKYLPYASTATDGSFKTDPFTEQATFMSARYPGEQVYYGQTDFEASPLNRVLKTMSPGNSWAGSSRGVAMSYETNVADEVRIWDINDFGEGAIPTSSGSYSAGELYRTVTTDEYGKLVVEYKDKEGQVVLKKVEIKHDGAAVITEHEGWLCTYYIYDDLNQLRFVLPPLAVEALRAAAVNWDISTAGIADELCFRYAYDGRRRMIAKKVPGAGWVYMVYDKRDRLVFTQDGNMHTRHWWLTTLYDNLNRPVQTGMLTYDVSRADLQSYVDGQTNAVQTSTQSGTTAGTPADLYITEHDGRSIYKASHSIVFEGNLEAGDFETEIVAADGASFTSSQEVSINPIPSGGTYIPLTFTYYDNYEWTNKTYTSTYNNKLDKGNNVYGEVLPGTASTLVKGLTTGTRIRVIEDAEDLSKGAWLESVSYYDDKGHVVQVQSDNYKGGTDLAVNRYDFTGKVISSYQVHNNASGNTVNNRVYTEMDYDHGGRLLAIRKTLNDDAATRRVIAHNSYDESGQLENRQLGQQTDASGTVTSDYLETQDYVYNIRGWLKGLNWEGYGNTGSSVTKATTGRWFAMDLSYDWGYNKNQYNGNIAGMRWQSGGDQQERSYGYDYDAANRLLSADFKQNNGGAWNNDLGGGRTIDFSVKMGVDGQNDGTAYDANGNIRRMQQWGLQAVGSSAKIDDLAYQYYNNTNKLSSVTDGVTAAQHLGDFTDKHTSGDDYGYDVNGNLLTDKNKGINGNTGIDQSTGTGGIRYNHLNLPWQIAVKDENGQDKGTITYIYDAAGNKLEKRVEELASAANNNTAKHTYTSYLGGYVYENNVLKFFGQEEGRIRPKRDASGSITGYAYDYFLKDHLGNIRTVLTDEHQTDAYPVASLEEAGIANERLYYDIPTGGLVNKNTVPDYPTDSYTSPNDWIQQLNGNGQKIGTGMVLKVMAGDKVNIHANSWYRTNGANPDAPVSLQAADLLSSLVGGIAGASSGSHAATQLQGNGNLSAGIGSFLSQSTDDYAVNGSGKPKAYLNYVLFDEQLNAVWTNDGKNSGFSQVGGDQVFTSHDVSGREMKKSGYLYIYVSNETPNIDVFFDNVQVTHERGALMEETHYYPFGLTMAGISSRAAGKLENKIGYNGNERQDSEFSDGSGLELYDFNARTYDQQTGRFIQIDPLVEQGAQEGLTPYHFTGNNPVRFNDPTGNCAWCKEVWKDIKSAARETAASVQRGIEATPGLAMGAVRAFNAYVNPLTPVVELATGKSVASDLTEDKSRMLAAGQTLMVVLPVLKAEGTLAAVTENLMTPKQAVASQELQTQVRTAAASAENAGKATVVGGELPNGAAAVGTSGPVPSIVAPNLQPGANALGGTGVKVNGNTVGCCAEFRTANQLLLQNPGFKPTDVKFTPVIRPRTGEVVPRCPNCEVIFGPEKKP